MARRGSCCRNLTSFHMRVFKYRGGDENIQRRDIRSLMHNKIYAASIDSLNDLFEAAVSIDGQSFRVSQLLNLPGIFWQSEKTKKAESELLHAVERFAENVKTWGVYSLSRSPIDDLFWSHYADSNRGFCLEYELDELLAYGLDGQSSMEVEYRDDIPVVSISDLVPINEPNNSLAKKFIGTKSKRWSHEAEVRIVTGQVGEFEYDFRALKAIYFGVRSLLSLQRLVMRVMAGRGITYYQVKRVVGQYALQIEKIEDAYPRQRKYRDRVAPIDSGAPYFDDKLTPYRDLVLKAMEIARRDPYCEKVTDAYISSLRGTKEDPVFYVTYDRSDGSPRNYFLSKSQIEKAV